MRAVHGVLCAILLLFAALQYNDPDWHYWGLVYLLAAGWSSMAALAPQRLQSSRPAQIGAALSILLFLILPTSWDRNGSTTRRHASRLAT